MNKGDKYFNSLHLGTRAATHEHAKQLRHTQTEAEQKLWTLLRNRQLKEKKFRRQHPIADYVLDFYCHECKLAIELDGEHHNREEGKEHDAARTKFLNESGIKVLRFWNEEVMNDMDKVIERISEMLT
jgi:type I restriction enzyme M protein